MKGDKLISFQCVGKILVVELGLFETNNMYPQTIYKLLTVANEMEIIGTNSFLE